MTFREAVPSLLPSERHEEFAIWRRQGRTFYEEGIACAKARRRESVNDIFRAAILSSVLPRRLSGGEESTCSVGGAGSVIGSGRSPGGGHGNPLQYSYLENPVDRGAWWTTVHGIEESDTTG